MNAETLAMALGGVRSGRGFIACCPAHDDRKKSLSINDSDKGRVLVHCHYGCPQNQVWAAIRAAGFQPNCGPRRPPWTTNSSDYDKAGRAFQIWREATSASGTPAEAYLRSRHLTLPPPLSLRFRLRLKHSPTGTFMPAMIALVTRATDGKPLAIQRTFLTADGSGKAPVEPSKMSLGPVKGGVIRLAEPDGGALIVGEGVETVLSVMQATGKPGWAAMSAGNLADLDLPKNVRDITLLADNDKAGERATLIAALRWRAEGRETRIARPPEGLNDFNDVLMRGRTARTAGGRHD
jgi:hypothetical protein